VVENNRDPPQQLGVDCRPREDIVYVTAVAIELTGKPCDRVVFGMPVDYLLDTLADMHHGGLLRKPFLRLKSKQ
jgi:hypothetical protein